MIRERERAAVPLDHGGRVPGHEPAPDRAARPARRRDEERDLFLVGDEFQSIYGFRHADVAVFRERRAAAPTVLPLTQNYRSRPGGARGGERALRQRSSATSSSGSSRPTGAGRPSCATAFELLVTDKEAAGEAGVHWRRSEARHVARRVRELVDAGVATPGRDRPPLRGGHRRRVVRGGAPSRSGCRRTARRAATTSASSRSSTCSRTCGSSTTATTTRRC